MNLLVLYDYFSPKPLRQTFRDHLESFGKYAKHTVFYCNVAYGIPTYLHWVQFDLVIFHQRVTGPLRWTELSYEVYVERLLPVKGWKCKKWVFCQDEFYRMDRLNRFIEEFEVDTIFSVAEESEWKKLYPHVDRKAVHIRKVLTGYLDPAVCSVIEKLEKESKEREIDVGYRAFKFTAALGRFGKRKFEVGERVKEVAEKTSLALDILTTPVESQLFHGHDWYRFLLRCRYALGVEGGASLLDWTGEVCEKVTQYEKQHSGASFEEVEAACFSGLDGNLNLKALSPRHLEACATKTCQVLVEGDYSGILQEGVHYIALKKDFSNVEEVIETLCDEERRQQIVDRAYQDIVLSGKYHYEGFVSRVLEGVETGSKNTFFVSLLFLWNQFEEWILWKVMPLECSLRAFLKKVLPSKIVQILKRG